MASKTTVVAPIAGGVLLLLAGVYAFDAYWRSSSAKGSSRSIIAGSTPSVPQLPRRVEPRPSTSAPDVGASALQTELLERVNEARRQGGVCGAFGALPPAAPLRPSAALRSTAELHAREMVANGLFDHKNSMGEGPSARAAKAGYPRPVSEALAWGQKSAADAVRAWLQSPEHCRSLLSTASLEAGFATATAEDGPRWVALFGR